jgi:hypothetical protein
VNKKHSKPKPATASVITFNKVKEPWYKTWVPIILSIFALIASITAIVTTVYIYRDTTKPLAQHTEIKDKLSRLDSRIERYDSVQVSLGHSGPEIQNKLDLAKTMRDQAEISWDKGNYNEAEDLIDQAFEVLSLVTFVEKTSNWQLIIGLAGGLVTIAIILLVINANRKDRHKS